MPLYFVTGNAGKFAEVKALMPKIEQLEIDVPEIQSLNPQEVIAAKLEAAGQKHKGEFIVEDTSLACAGLGGLPGTLVKWFEEALGLAGIAELAAKSGNTSCCAITVIGYRDSRGKHHFFEGRMTGEIVAPRGKNGFGWNPIVAPEGLNHTMAELEPKILERISMRSKAVWKLAAYLEK